MENDIWSNCKTFQPAKWGFVHIPQYHYTAEQAIISAIRADGGLTTNTILVAGGSKDSLSPEFYRNFEQSTSDDSFMVNWTQLQWEARNQIELSWALSRCSEKNITVKYEDYYQTEWWLMVRDHVLSKNMYSCALCGGWKDLQVHHRTYKRIGCESVLDLTVLCEECHGLWHKAKKGADAYQKIQNFMTAFKELERSI